jgi:hypothetical protein
VRIPWAGGSWSSGAPSVRSLVVDAKDGIIATAGIVGRRVVSLQDILILAAPGQVQMTCSGVDIDPGNIRLSALSVSV